MILGQPKTEWKKEDPELDRRLSVQRKAPWYTAVMILGGIIGGTLVYLFFQWLDAP